MLPPWSTHQLLLKENTVLTVPLKSGNVISIRTVGDYLSFVREQAEFFLNVTSFVGKQCAGGSACVIPGNYCDGCGKIRREDETTFLACSRCKITYYCDKGKASECLS